MKTTKSTKSIALTSAESALLLAAIQIAQNAVANLQEYKTFSNKLFDLETTVRQQS